MRRPRPTLTLAAAALVGAPTHLTKVLSDRRRRFPIAVSGFGRSMLLLALATASLGLESTAAGSPVSQHLPNPCKLLARAHPETAFNQGKTLTVSHRQSSHEFDGAPVAICAEAVGSHSVELWLSTALHGVVPAATVRSQKHLSGLGPDATLTVYSFKGAVSQAITFHREIAPAPIFEAVFLPGATHSAALETLARRIYTEF
jgi:hypothetical protein